MGEQWGWTWRPGSRKQPHEEEAGWGELAGPCSTREWFGFYARCTGKPLGGKRIKRPRDNLGDSFFGLRFIFSDEQRRAEAWAHSGLFTWRPRYWARAWL